MNDNDARQLFVQNLTNEIDKTLNGDPVPPPQEKTVGFILLVFPLNVEGAGCTIATNGLSKESVIDILRTQADLLSPKN